MTLCLRDGECHELAVETDEPGVWKCAAGHIWYGSSPDVLLSTPWRDTFDDPDDLIVAGHHRTDEPEVCVAGHLLGAMGWTVAGVAACVTAIVAWWRRR